MDLTPRQREVATLVARGWSDKRIAREVGVSVDTIKQHVGDAASRLPGSGRPRHKLMVWFFGLTEERERYGGSG